MTTTPKTANSPGLSNGNNDPAGPIPSPVRSNNFDGITALMVACQQGHPDDVQKIIKKKVIFILKFWP